MINRPISDKTFLNARIFSFRLSILNPIDHGFVDAYKIDRTGNLTSQTDVCALMLKQTAKQYDIADLLISKLNSAAAWLSRYATNAAAGMH
jgi:hypothetical protein